jgi:hypothetical protein
LSARAALRLAALALGAGSGASGAGCKGAPVSRPFHCDRVQARAETCAAAVLAHLGAQAEVDVRTGAVTEDATVLVHTRKVWFTRALRARRPAARCEAVRLGDSPGERRAYTAFKYCVTRPTCAEFAACVLPLL